MTLKVYADRLSQPSRAVILFCKLNRIEFEEIKIDVSKRRQLSPEFREINPMRKVPAIVDGRFKLFESHAILVYLACAFPGVADHWYPADVSKRAKIHSVLDWHHSNLRVGSAKYVLNTVLAPALGLPFNRQAAAEAEIILNSSLSKIESIWLKGSGNFLLGSRQPSIADLSLVCEIMQLEILDDEDRSRILGPYKKVQQWIEDTKNATKPHFCDVHAILFNAKARFQKKSTNSGTESNAKTSLYSKI
ncbi:Glutathione S-transferase theta-1 [Ancistrocladus abbreviatus]